MKTNIDSKRTRQYERNSGYYLFHPKFWHVLWKGMYQSDSVYFAGISRYKLLTHLPNSTVVTDMLQKVPLIKTSLPFICHSPILHAGSHLCHRTICIYILTSGCLASLGQTPYLLLSHLSPRMKQI